MPGLSTTSRAASGGFSLLELVVAIVILAFTLGAMYQLAGGATRTVGIDEKTVYGVELARSLRANYAVVPPEGVGESGETEGGFAWEVQTEPLALPEETRLKAGQLQTISIAVRWQDGDKEREYRLRSIAVGKEPEPF